MCLAWHNKGRADPNRQRGGGDGRFVCIQSQQMESDKEEPEARREGRGGRRWSEVTGEDFSYLKLFKFFFILLVV